MEQPLERRNSLASPGPQRQDWCLPISPSSMIKMLFSGNDARGQTGLWESNGTAAGTHELTGIIGAETTRGRIGPLRSDNLQWRSAVPGHRFEWPLRVVGDQRNSRRNA